MSLSNPCGGVVQAEGIVQHVDRLTREVGVQVGGTLLVFDVPADCAIHLNGERVRLRLLLPRDRVEVVYSPGSDRLVAHSIRVIGSPGTEPACQD
jgi:hypothetical protein